MMLEISVLNVQVFFGGLVGWLVDHLVVRDSERYVTIFMSACVVITAAMAVLLRDYDKLHGHYPSSDDD
jgi:hypothetical protein